MASKGHIVKKQPEAIEVPDYLRRERGNEAAGFEEHRQGDVVIARMALCQSMTPQRKRDSSKYIEGLDEGMLFNSQSEKIYGETALVDLMGMR